MSKKLTYPGRADPEEWSEYLKKLKVFFSSYRSASVRAICKLDGCPYLQVIIYEQIYTGLLDSGSSISILGLDSADCFLRAGFQLNESYHIKSIITANDSRAEVKGYINLPVTLRGITKIISFFVVPHVTTRIIFGVDVWQAFDLAPQIFGSLPFVGSEDGALVSEIRHLFSFDQLEGEERGEAEKLVKGFQQISFENRGLGRTSLLQHTINTADAVPIKQRYYCLSPERLMELNKQLDEMIALDVVEPSSSAWNNPTLLAPKANGELRFCIDSRKLNAVSKHDAYPLPYITSILDQLRDARYLSSIDLKAAFWQIELDPTSREKTAFTVPGRGLFQFKVMCFGLTGAPATQQRLMDRLFGPEFGGKVFCYLDDIVVVSSTFSEHISLLNRVMEKLKQANLTINLNKSQFFRRELKYLGYVVDDKGLRTDPMKVQAVVDFPVPTSRKEVKMFLGTASYYRRFIRNFSSIAAPLNALTSNKKNAPAFKWGEVETNAFNELKSALVTAPVLACPDFSRPFTLHCDASGFGIAGTLTQESENGEEHPIAYASRSLNRAERNYSATEREALGVIFSIEHFRPYIEGKRFRVITDHSSLKWFMNLSNPTGRLARWGCRLSSYDFEIVHRRGRDNIVPDALSRSVPVLPIQTTKGNAWYQGIYTKCKQFPTACPNYSIQNDVLYRYSRNKIGSQEFDWKEVVPVDRREELIKTHHCGILATHMGIFKTYKRLSLKYYWPSMYGDVVFFVNRCEVCLAYKHSQKPTPGLMGSPKVCSRPFETISMDLVGPLPRSRAGFTFLLVVVCCFSKYCLIFPLRRAVGSIIAKKLEEGVFMVHGVPRTVIADNGSQFTGSDLKTLFQRYKIPQVHLTPRYSPQVNTVERYNRTIVTALSILVGRDHRTWDLAVPKIQFSMNISTNETTRFTPYYLVHGREAVACGSYYGYSSVDALDLVCASRVDYSDKLCMLQGTFSSVKQAIEKAHLKSAKYYDASRRPLEFAPGDIVWKRTYPLSDASKFFMAKLAPKYDKCTVLRKISSLVYELEDFHTKKNLGAWHVKDLKPQGFSE